MWYSQLLYSQQATEPDDAEDGLLENEKTDEIFLHKPNDSKLPRNRQRRSWWSWVLQFAVFLCSLTLFILSRYSEPSDVACTRKLSTYCSSTPESSPKKERVGKNTHSWANSSQHRPSKQWNITTPPSKALLTNHPFTGGPLPQNSTGNRKNLSKGAYLIFPVISCICWIYQRPIFQGGIIQSHGLVEVWQRPDGDSTRFIV